MTILHFEILGIPASKQSAKFASIGGKIRSYQPRDVVEKENNIAWQIKEQLPKDFTPTDKPVSVKELLFVFPALKSMTKKEKEFISQGFFSAKSTKPDLQDNLCKMLFDAMQGIVYINDSQIWQIEKSSKVYGLQPRIEFILEF